MPDGFQLKHAHRLVLMKRNENGKVAMPLRCDVLEPWVLRAVIDLSVGGVISYVGTTLLPFDEERSFICDVYQLTAAGRELCERHAIEPESYRPEHGDVNTH